MARRATGVAEQRAPLSKERVMRAALSLADERGMEALTMRALAQQLHVEAMSLYYYVANKDDILTGIVDLVASEIDVPPADADWKRAIRRSATSYHDALARHPWATGVMMSGPPGVGPAHLRYSDSLLRRLREAGFSPELTHHAYHALESHVVGSRLWAAGISTAMKKNAAFVQRFIRELPVKEFPYFAEHVQQHVTKSVRASSKNEFEFGLDLILDGLERLRDAEWRRSSSKTARRGASRESRRRTGKVRASR